MFKESIATEITDEKELVAALKSWIGIEMKLTVLMPSSDVPTVRVDTTLQGVEDTMQFGQTGCELSGGDAGLFWIPYHAIRRALSSLNYIVIIADRKTVTIERQNAIAYSSYINKEAQHDTPRL